MKTLKQRIADAVEGYDVYGWADYDVGRESEYISINWSAAEELADLVLQEISREVPGAAG